MEDVILPELLPDNLFNVPEYILSDSDRVAVTIL
jgi:hypothetical protein